MNLGTNKKIIFTFGFLQPSKGLDYAIDAFSTAKSEIKDLLLIIAGVPHPIWGSEMTKQLAKKRKEHNLLEN